jgi:hypothetical protein
MSDAETTHSEISGAVEIEHPAEPPTGIALFALRKGQCKYPLGGMFEPASRFCGCDAPIGSPYCAAHRAVAYRPYPRGGH